MNRKIRTLICCLWLLCAADATASSVSVSVSVRVSVDGASASSRGPIFGLARLKQGSALLKSTRIHHGHHQAHNTGSGDSNNHLPLAANTAALLPARGGGCDDARAALFGKLGIGALLQTLGLMGVLALGKAAAPILSDRFHLDLPDLFGTSPAILASFVVIIFASSFVGSLVDGGTSAAFSQALDPNTTPGDPDWYDNLKKPWWNPPGWLFPIMWLLVSKPTQLAAVNRLWRATTDGPARGWRLAAYCLHLSLGDAWNKTFFGYQCIGRGLGVILMFYAMLLLSTYLFWTVDPVAGMRMLPTCGWVTVATALQWSLYKLNRKSN